jgi:hypothetical protein
VAPLAELCEMQTRSSISYRQHPAVAPEAELSALVGIYVMALAAAERKEAAGPRQASDPSDGSESKGDSANDLTSKASAAER